MTKVGERLLRAAREAREMGHAYIKVGNAYPEEERRKAAAVAADDSLSVRERLEILREGPHLNQVLRMMADEIDALKGKS